jgi:hypothetical protein
VLTRNRVNKEDGAHAPIVTDAVAEETHITENGTVVI